MIASIFSFLLFGIISLDGVSGEGLRARSFFDANNVRLGDPMILTIDFIGNAEFTSLHPPALSREVDKKVWKIDDTSAKTETVDNARRLTYRVRPIKEGLCEFPTLTFSYSDFEGKECIVSTRSLPVHIKPGVQAALGGLEIESDNLLMPDGIHFDPGVDLDDDTRFAWEKACRNPTAKSFAPFDFPNAKLNEAACHIIEGNWAKANKIYYFLEWQIGQTPEIERGLLAALSRKNGVGELPVLREVLRPILKFNWKLRVLSIIGILLAIIFIFWVSARIIRIFVVISFVLLSLPTFAQQQSNDPFEEMDRMMQRMQQNMNSMMGGFQNSAFSFNGIQQPKVEVKASLEVDKKKVTVGEEFNIIISLETSKGTTLENLRLDTLPSHPFLGTQISSGEELVGGEAKNASNVVRRISMPVRYDFPFSGKVGFVVVGMARGNVTVGKGNNKARYSFSQSFSAKAKPIEIKVEPLDKKDQPEDFFGAVGVDFSLSQSVDINEVETNDVVTITTMLEYKGYLPTDKIPDIIYHNRREGKVLWKEYFVARGETATPEFNFVFYDVTEKKYRYIKVEGTPLKYVANSAQTKNEIIAVDVGEKDKEKGLIRLYFYPSENAPIIATIPQSDTDFKTIETYGKWKKIESSTHSGWIK